MMKLALALTLAVTIAAPVWAAEGTLVTTSGGQTKIPVWRSAQAQDDGQALLRAKADASLVAPLLACIAEPGTRVVIGGPDPGLYRRGVMILNGPSKGWRGIVAKENLTETEPQALPKKSYPPPDCRKPTDQWTGEKCVRTKQP